MRRPYGFFIVLATFTVIFNTGVERIYATVRHVTSDANTSGCPLVENTPFFTSAYGSATFDGAPVPVGTTITAHNPRGDAVGCFIVSTEGSYGAMFIYGEDTSVSPSIPGMRASESVTFQIGGVKATASSTLFWQSDKDIHEVTLSSSSGTPIAMPASAEYGVFQTGMATHQNDIFFSFPGQSGAITLNFAAWDVDYLGEVSVYVNNRFVGYVPANGTVISPAAANTPDVDNEWTAHTLNVADEFVNDAAGNVVTFDRTTATAQPVFWGIRDVQLDANVVSAGGEIHYVYLPSVRFSQ